MHIPFIERNKISFLGISRREIRKRIQLPGIEVRVVLRAVDTLTEQPDEPGRFTIALNDLTELLTASSFLGVRNDDVIGDPVAAGDPVPEEQSFFDIENTISNRPDLTINAVPLLSE